MSFAKPLFAGELVESYSAAGVHAVGRGVAINPSNTQSGYTVTMNTSSKHGRRYCEKPTYAAALTHATRFQRRKGLI